MSTSYKTYQPGVCNIGPKERRRRLRGGIIGFAITIVLYFIIIIFSLPSWSKLFLFFPLFGAFVGLYQYTMNFCVYFAGLAKYNME